MPLWLVIYCLELAALIAFEIFWVTNIISARWEYLRKGYKSSALRLEYAEDVLLAIAIPY